MCGGVGGLYPVYIRDHSWWSWETQWDARIKLRSALCKGSALLDPRRCLVSPSDSAQLLWKHVD